MITHGSLFTGIGVFDLAAKQNGCQNVYGCDIDLFAKLHYAEHYPGGTWYNDIKEIKELPTVDIMTFGFPCQDASLARPDKTNIPLQSSRTGLFYEAIRLIQQSRPTWVIAENVASIAQSSGHDIHRAFSKSGYISAHAIIPACTFGALHRRSRIFFIAYAHSERWHQVIRVLNGTLAESQRQKQQLLGRRLDDTICTDLWNEANQLNVGRDYGTTAWLLEGLRTKAIGNAIYYPVAETIIREITKEINFI